jgi:hypothetical protein
MNSSQEYHREAMRKADEAQGVRGAGDHLRALQLFSTAYFLERLAADTYRDRSDIEPTRSVLYRSAAALAQAACRFDDAGEAIELGLDGNPPSEIKSELLELKNAVASRSANWTGAIRDFKALIFSRDRKSIQGNVLAIELSRVALKYGQNALEALWPSEYLAILLRVDGETMRSMLTPDDWHTQVIEPTSRSSPQQTGEIDATSDPIQKVKDFLEINIPVEGSLSLAALTKGTLHSIGDASASDAAAFSEVEFFQGTFRTLLAVPVRVSIDKAPVVAVLLILGIHPTQTDEGVITVRRIVDDLVALLELALTIGARTRAEAKGKSRRRPPKGKRRGSH